MSAATPTLRELANNGVLQTLADVDRDTAFGDLLGMLIRTITPTETGASVADDTDDLAAAASMVFDVNATTADVTGRKKLLIGKTSGQGAIVPQTGEVVWSGPGTTTLVFAAADNVSVANYTYAKSDASNVLTSIGQRTLGEVD